MDLKSRREKKDQDNGSNVKGNKKKEVKPDKTTTLSHLLLCNKQNQGNKVDGEKADLNEEKTEWIIWKVSPSGQEQSHVLARMQSDQEPELGLLLAPVDPLQSEEGDGEP